MLENDAARPTTDLCETCCKVFNGHSSGADHGDDMELFGADNILLMMPASCRLCLLIDTRLRRQPQALFPKRVMYRWSKRGKNLGGGGHDLFVYTENTDTARGTWAASIALAIFPSGGKRSTCVLMRVINLI
jgi:hypothetical protein